MVKFIPDRRDIVWMNFEPQKGREIQKKRPALIVSPKEYNERAHLALCMPITSKIKNYPFEVIIDEKLITGAILSDQVRSFDWRSRNATFIMKCNVDIFNEAIYKFRLLID